MTFFQTPMIIYMLTWRDLKGPFIRVTFVPLQWVTYRVQRKYSLSDRTCSAFSHGSCYIRRSSANQRPMTISLPDLVISSVFFSFFFFRISKRKKKKTLCLFKQSKTTTKNDAEQTKRTVKQKKNWKKMQKAYSSCHSRVVSHPSTAQPIRGLTFVIGRARVLSPMYGRKHKIPICRGV